MMRNNIITLRFTALFSLTLLYSYSPAHRASESYLTHLAGEEGPTLHGQCECPQSKMQVYYLKKSLRDPRLSLATTDC